MEKIIDNLNFAGLKELWNVLISDCTIDEYLNVVDIDNEDN